MLKKKFLTGLLCLGLTLGIAFNTATLPLLAAESQSRINEASKLEDSAISLDATSHSESESESDSASTEALIQAAAQQAEAVNSSNVEEYKDNYVDGDLLVCVKGDENALKGKVNAQMELLLSDGDYSFILLSGDSTANLMAAVEKIDCVQFAEPNYYMETQSVNDPLFAYQYTDPDGNRTGANAAIAASIEKEASKTLAESDFKAVVAVVDTGVDYTHPELDDVMWKDGLNYPSLTALGGGQYGINVSGEGETTDPLDTNRHGTNCASIIAAEINNDLGMAGMSRNVEIMAVQVAKGSAAMKNSCIIEGINYVVEAKKAGVKVAAINLSLGATNIHSKTIAAISCALKLAENYGIITVNAAGNESANTDLSSGLYHASNNTLVVGAINKAGEKADYSNYGQTSVDLFAPGELIIADSTNKNSGLCIKGQYSPLYSQDFNSYNIEDDLSTAEAMLISSVGKTEICQEGGNKYCRYTYPDGAIFSKNLKTIKIKKDKWPDLNNYQQIGVYLDAKVTTEESYGSLILLLFQRGENNSYTRCGYAFINSESWTCVSASISVNGLVEAGEYYEFYFTLYAVTEQEAVANGLSLNIDNICISETNPYYNKESGTSFSAPVVTGLVAQIVAADGKIPQNKSDVERIYNIVTSSVTESDNLTDYAKTNGYANPSNALELVAGNESHAHPVVRNLVRNSDGSYSLKGAYFGESQGQLKIGDRDISSNIIQWTSNKITFTGPTLDKGSYEFKIKRTDNSLEGRNFFEYGESQISFEDLETDMSLISTDISRQLLATDFGLVLFQKVINSNTINFYFYSHKNNMWTKLNLTEKEIDYCSFAVGKEEAYIILRTKESPETYLFTINTRNMTVQNCLIDFDDESRQYDLWNYEDQLIILDSDTGQYLAAVYPNTGKVYRDYRSESLFDEDSDFSDALSTLNSSMKITENQYDGYGWTETTTGYILTGPMAGINSPNIADTWIYNKETQSWSKANVLFSGEKTGNIVGAAYGDYLYVLANYPRGKMSLKRLKLSDLGLTAVYNTQDAKKENTLALDNTKEKDNFAGAGLGNDIEELKQLILTDEDLAAIAAGKNISIWSEIKDQTDSVSDTDKKYVNDALPKDYNVGYYLDINIWKMIEGQDANKVTDIPNGKLKISFTIPEGLQKEGRIYKLVRIHNGRTDILDVTLSDNNLATAESDAFSTYALIYIDKQAAKDEKTTPIVSVPNTGDGGLVLELSLIMLMSLGLITLTLRKKKTNNI